MSVDASWVTVSNRKPRGGTSPPKPPTEIAEDATHRHRNRHRNRHRHRDRDRDRDRDQKSSHLVSVEEPDPVQNNFPKPQVVTMASSLIRLINAGKPPPSVTELPQVEAQAQVVVPIPVHELNDTWVLWFHDLTSSDWNLTGYEKLFSFKTIEDFWVVMNNLQDLNNGMYYIMRLGYPPIWDHDKTKEGGAFTFKVNKRNLNRNWETLLCYALGETICAKSENIIGISVSPKIQHATIRIWTGNTDKNPDTFRHLNQDQICPINFIEARFTANKDASC